MASQVPLRRIPSTPFTQDGGLRRIPTTPFTLDAGLQEEAEQPSVIETKTVTSQWLNHAQIVKRECGLVEAQAVIDVSNEMGWTRMENGIKKYRSHEILV